MRTINEISDAVRRGERISTDDAIVLWREAPLWLLGELATERKRSVSGEYVFYNRNVHIEPSNICLFNCEFCSFRRREGDADAWFMSVDEVEARAIELQSKDITEVHIVGGVHPSHTLETYCDMIRRVKSALPHVSVKAYTAVELFYMIRKAEVTVVEGLRRLMEAGMDSIPGGGAEIFDEELRKKICPDKCGSDEWLAVHRAAHHMGLHTNCTMLYGHIESIEQRVDHLNRLRDLQDYAPGFDAFIPLKYRSRNNRMSHVGETSVEDDLRTIAVSRIFLDNIHHIKAYWVAYGKATTEIALAYGADDIDGTIDDSTKIYSMAGADARPTMSVEELEALVRDAGFVPVERDTHYNIVDRDGRYASMSGLGAVAAGVAAAATAVEEVAAATADVVAAASEVASEVASEAGDAPVEAPSEVASEVVDAPIETPSEVAEAHMESSPEELHATDDAPYNDVASSESAANLRATMPDGESRVKVQNEINEDSDNSMTKSEKFWSDVKRFWQGVKRSYKRFRIIYHIFFIGIFLLCVVGALYLGLKVGTRHGKTIKLPNFEKLTLDEAREIADELDLQIVIRDERYDEQVVPGLIIDQNPKPSDIRTVRVKPGRRIYVTINAVKSEDNKVPYVAKQSLSEALQKLYIAGFVVDELIYEPGKYENIVQKQEVNNRMVDASTMVMMPRGTGVTLYLSYDKKAPYTELPNILNTSLVGARAALWQSGFNVGDIEYDSSVDMRDRRNALVYKLGVASGDAAPYGMKFPYGESVTLYMTADTLLARTSYAEAIDIVAKNRRLAPPAVFIEDEEVEEDEFGYFDYYEDEYSNMEFIDGGSQDDVVEVIEEDVYNDFGDDVYTSDDDIDEFFYI